MEALAFKIEQLDLVNDGEQQARYDLQTQFSELVDGSMRTQFELRYDGHDLCGEDGRSITEISNKALTDAKALAKSNPELWFEIRRRGYERDEIRELVEMAGGEGSNAMVVVSDFPPELLGASEDMGGYNVTRQQTMLRVLVRKSNGNIQMYSQSLDESDRQALEAIYTHLGKSAEPGELLSQRIRANIAPERLENLIDELTGVYDRSLTAQHGGEWYAGRRPVDYRNTYDFVCRQHDLIEEGVRLQNLGWLTTEILYKMAATMNERFKEDKLLGVNNVVRIVAVDPVAQHALYRELEANGRRAQQMGLTFSACGVTLGAKNADGTPTDSSAEQDLTDAGYGNRSSLPAETGGPCVYVHDGCYCCGFNDDGSPRISRMKVLAKRGSDGVAHCLRKGCGAWLAGDGTDFDIGMIAKKAQNRASNSMSLSEEQDAA